MTSVTPFPARYLMPADTAEAVLSSTRKYRENVVCRDLQLIIYKYIVLLACCIGSRWTACGPAMSHVLQASAQSYRAYLHNHQQQDNVSRDVITPGI